MSSRAEFQHFGFVEKLLAFGLSVDQLRFKARIPFMFFILMVHHFIIPGKVKSVNDGLERKRPKPKTNQAVGFAWRKENAY